MSIVALPDPSRTRIRPDDLQRTAIELGFEIKQVDDAQDYLLALQSLESLSRDIEDGPDYVPPSLLPHPTKNLRSYSRPEKIQNPLNAWSHRCCLESSKPSNTLLAGRSIAIKDNVSVGGLPTTVGTFDFVLSKDSQYPISPIDAPIVSRILAAGAIISGTSTCENYSMSPLAYTSATGPVQNPILLGYTTGGSSSGSCALIAANVINRTSSSAAFGDTVDIAIGGDQAGSIRIPASYTGIYGHKPTFGLVPYTGAASLSPMIDHLGPLASNLEDIAILLKVIAGYDGLDPRMSPETPLISQVKDYPELLSSFRAQVSQKKREVGKAWKIGLLTESFSFPGISSEVRDTVIDAARIYFEAAGALVQDVSIPMHLAAPTIWTVASRLTMSQWCNQARPGGHLTALAPHLSPKWPMDQHMYESLTAHNPAVVNVALSGEYARRAISPAVEAKAHRKVFELRAAYDTALEEFDVLVTPCAPTVAMPHPKLFDEQGVRTRVMEKLRLAVGLTNNTCPFNITGHPAMNVPCGFGSVPEHPEIKLPIGMQIVGRRWMDEQVMFAAALFEEGRQIVASSNGTEGSGA